MSELILQTEDIRKLLGAGSGDAALLYLCNKTGADPEGIGLSRVRLDAAAAFLRQVGLTEPENRRILPADTPPVYTAADVAAALENPDSGFSALVKEAEARFGRILRTEEVKTLLSISEYLALPNEVIAVLVNFCIEQTRARCNGKMPSLRAIEKEAFRWSDENIDTIETAAAYVRTSNLRREKIAQLAEKFGFAGRALTATEKKYFETWLGQGFDTPEIMLAYEKTCANTGGLKWNYLNAILAKWHENNLHTLAEIEAGDRKTQNSPRNGSKRPVAQQHGKITDPLMKQAIARAFADKQED